MKKQYWAGFAALVLVLTVCTVLFARAGKNKEDNETLYGHIIAKLGDDEQFSLRDIGEKNDVLFTTDMTYDDRNGHNAGVYCDVYYALGGEEYPLGRIKSLGTAWPVS